MTWRFQFKSRKGKNGFCFSDTDTVVSFNQSHLSDPNLNFICINLKEWILQLYYSILRILIQTTSRFLIPYYMCH